MSSSFLIENGLKQGDALLPLLFNFTLEYAIRKVQEINLGLDMNGTPQVLAHADENGEWRRFHNEELHSLYRSHKI